MDISADDRIRPPQIVDDESQPTSIDSIHEFVIERLQASKGQWSIVAEATGISKRTIEKIGRRIVANPGVKTVEKLAQYFRSQAAA